MWLSSVSPSIISVSYIVPVSLFRNKKSIRPPLDCLRSRWIMSSSPSPKIVGSSSILSCNHFSLKCLFNEIFSDFEYCKLSLIFGSKFIAANSQIDASFAPHRNVSERGWEYQIRCPFFHNRFAISWISAYNHYQIRLDNTKCALRIGWCLSFSTIQNTHCVNDAIWPVSNTICAIMRAVSSECPAGFLCSPSFSGSPTFNALPENRHKTPTVSGRGLAVSKDTIFPDIFSGFHAGINHMDDYQNLKPITKKAATGT